ncbi:MAG: protein kinase [Anaerolineae bacterium]|nr:protein kinase [Anaerolineae bacterium]
MTISDKLNQKNLELIERIGEGGAGAVYRAHQAILDREVAVKVILPHLANHPDFIRNFELEAQLIARLEHPHIVPLYDFWRDPDGAYIVMRYLRGGSLRDRMDERPLSLVEVDVLFDQLTNALSAAHRASVVHRDLKPDNILLDEDGNAYLSDFGIARHTGHSPTEENVSGTLAYIAPEQLMSHPTHAAMDIYSMGIILFELITGHHPFKHYPPGQIIQMHLNEPLPELMDFRPDLPERLGRVLQKATSKAPEDRYDNIRDLWRDFHRCISKGDTSSFDREAVEKRNPYKGLRPFEEADAGDFFGREVLVEELLKRMTEDMPYRNFLAVVGASGSGKSSLIRAGVIPHLRSGVVPGSNRWFICEMIPGASPISALTQALLSVAPGAPPRLQEQLESDPRALLWAIDNMMAKVEGDLLLFIDQFEEVFTMTREESERAHFLDLLRHAVSAEGSRFRVIVTLRADFYDRPLHYEGFGEIMQQRTQVVLSLNVNEIERAITSPAYGVGAQVNTDLVAAIIADVKEEPGVLPLLQYALTEVYERSDGMMLTLDAYLESGGVEGALARRAEDVYERLNESEQETAHQLFLRLVTLGDQAVDTRRRAKQSELLSITGGQREQVEAVLEQFGEFRLLAFDRDSVTREPTIEIAHEALIRGWQRLRTWLDEGREDLRMQSQLAKLAEDWVKAGRDESYLLRGVRLSQFKEWGQPARLKLNLTPVERELLDTSIREEEKETAIREAAQRDKERLTARTQSQQRQLIAVLVVGVVMAGLLSVLALIQGNRAQNEADQNATAQFVAQEQADDAENARATAQANAESLRTALDEIRSLNMVDSALQALENNDIDSAIALAAGVSAISEPSEPVQRMFADIAPLVYTAGTLAGHSNDVRAIAYSPDGSRLVSAGIDRKVLMWDMTDGTILHEMEEHTQPILAVDYSADGRYAASGDNRGLVIIWDAASGAVIHRLEGHAQSVHGLAFSPDTAQLASASADGTIILWDVETGEAMERFAGHDGAVLAVDYSPDGRRLASGSLDDTIRLWDVETGEVTARWDTGYNVRAVVFSPDGTQVASASDENTIKLWDSESGAVLRTFSGHINQVLSVQFNSTGTEIVSASADSTVRVWDSVTGESLQVYRLGNSRIFSAVFHPRNHLIASASSEDTIRLWNVQPIPLNRPLVLRGQQDDVHEAAFSPDGAYVLSGSGSLFDPVPNDKRMILWDWQTGEQIRILDGHSDTVTAVAWSPDGRQALSASRDGTLIVWDVATGEALRRFEGHTDWVWDADFSPDGKQALSASRDGTLILWDVGSGDIIQRLTAHGEWVNVGIFSPDGRLIASGSDDRRVLIWDAQTGAVVRELIGHEGSVHNLAFSPDGRLLISVSADTTAILWDVQRGELMARFFDHQAFVNGVDFSPNGEMFVTGSADGEVVLWDAATNQSVRAFSGEGAVLNATFSPDGQWVMTTFDSGLIRIYPLNQAVVLDWITEHVYLRPFSCEERQRFGIEPLCLPEVG